ncbi:MAG: ATP-dependent Clp protease ATP-binding subunit ClpA, partial [Dehalococcoidia bacterium]
MQLTKELQEVLYAAFDDARRRRHEYLTLEHVLFAMTNDRSSSKILRSVGINLDELRNDLELFFAESIDPMPGNREWEPQQTPAFQRVLQRATVHVQSAGKDTVDAGHVLASIYREPASHAVYLLEKQGVSRLDVLEYVSHGVSRVSDDGELVGHDDEFLDDEDGAPTKNALETYAVDLTQLAAEGRMDPLIGRANELERTIQVLSRRRKNNPIYVGDAGVGKTAMVEGLAQRIAEGKVPAALRDARIYSLDMGSLIAGTKFRGEFEQRLKGVISQVQKQPGAILFIDEIHTIYGAGSTSNGSLDASNMLKPALTDGTLRCIGSTTFSDYKATFEKDRALARRFQKIDILEPSTAETIEILKGLKKQYEEHHQVTYTPKAIRAAAELAAKHINDALLPDKAVDVLDEAGAMVRLRGVDGARVTSDDIEAVVAKIARIPTQSVSVSDRENLAHLEDELKQVIYGQDQAIDNLVSAIKLSRSGLGSPEKPVGSFLFSGPTGVGKTELAKQLARILGVEFLRFDMSEYMEKHTVSRLIGAPPGYVGYDQGGQLTDAVRKTPYAVLVLDEIEKAHPDVFNILLQVMDHATLTDNTGRKADFRNIILVMTTNAGAQELTRESLGFGGSTSGTTQQKNDRIAIERTFSPEFRNRLDAWITFSTLAPATVDKIVNKFVREMTDQLAAKNVSIELTEEARVWLRDKGYDKLYGARPMGRVIQNELKRPLADAILFGALANGGTAKVALGKGDD